uniref:Spermatogenesis-associated protein 6 N-terminal domain-containing protein n=1 Tax=Oryzias latipes TaxID=8090 RepID=A0A3P9HP80_ORYLA
MQWGKLGRIRNPLHSFQVTCPGVFLENKSDINLSVCIMGQRRTTPSFPPLFPVLFQSKLTFEKTFSGVVDPADVADLLEGKWPFGICRLMF